MYMYYIELREFTVANITLWNIVIIRRYTKFWPAITILALALINVSYNPELLEENGFLIQGISQGYHLSVKHCRDTCTCTDMGWQQ